MKIWFDSRSHFQLSRSGYTYDIGNARNDECDDECGKECSPAYNYECSDCGDNDCSRTYSHECDSECSSDCDSECAAGYSARCSHPNSLLTVDQEDLARLTTHRLQLSSTLYIQACDTSHWLLCNPATTGEIAVIDEDALTLLQSFRAPTRVQEIILVSDSSISSLLSVISIFIDLGFLCDLDQLPVTHNENSQGSTLSAWLHVTNACNLRCSYCYVSKSSEHMEQETSKGAVDAVMRSAVRHGYRNVNLKYAGGEAALRLPQVIAIHDYAQQQAQEQNLRLSAVLMSNGTIMTQRMIGQLKKRGIRVTLSLDGIGATHDRQRPYINGLEGSFTMVERTIARLLAHDLKPSINVTVSQRTIADLPALLSYILEHDLHFTLSYYRENDCSSSLADLQFSEVQMIEGMRTAFVSIEDHLPRRRIINSLIDKGSMGGPHNYTCGIGRNYLVINQRGEIAKCQADITRAVTTIQADDPLHEIRNDQSGMQAVDVDAKEGCRSCSWRYWCAGGCPLVTYRATGRNDIRSPNCAIYKALYPEALRLEALRLLTYAVPVALANPVLC